MDFSNVKTREGSKVTIICTNARGKYPVLGYIEDEDFDELVTWTLEGKFVVDSDNHYNDLIEQTKTLEAWTILFKSGEYSSFSSYSFSSEEEAKRYAEDYRDSCDYKIIALHNLVKE